MANSTLFLTGFPSTLVRSPADAVRKFFPLMSILKGAAAPCTDCVEVHFPRTQYQFNQKRGLTICAKPDIAQLQWGVKLVTKRCALPGAAMPLAQLSAHEF
jgi:hypothetical protein